MHDKRSYTEYTVTTATTDFVIGFDDYDDGTKDTIVVTVNGVLAESQGYAVMRKNAQVVTITPAVQSGTVRLTRVTDIDESFHQFTAGALFSAKSVDENFEQVRHSQQEVRDGFEFLEFNTNGVISDAKAATDRANAAAELAENTDVVQLQLDLTDQQSQLTAQKLDTGIISTAKFGGVARSLADKGTDFVFVEDFGDVGGGVVDARQTLEQAMQYAADTGRTLHLKDKYLINSASPNTTYGAGIFIGTDNGLNVLCERNAEIIVGDNLQAAINANFVNGAVIRINRITDTVGKAITWSGGRFDLRKLTTRSTTGIDGLSIGAKYKNVDIEGVVFDHGVRTASGSDLGYGVGDSSIFCKEPEKLSITKCHFYGAPDLGIYLSGDDNTVTRVGKDALISGNYFYRCNSGVAAKRDFKKMVVSQNHFLECGDGIFCGVTDGSETNTGKSVIITSNYLYKTQGNPIRLSNTTNSVVAGNQVLDYRRYISDGVTALAVSSSNQGGAVLLLGCTGYTVTGNILGFDEWQPVTGATRTVGVVMSNHTIAGVEHGSKDGIVVGNTIRNCDSAFVVSNQSSNNTLSPNTLSGMLNASTLGSDATNADMGLVDDMTSGFRYYAKGIYAAITGGKESLRFQEVANSVNNLVVQAGTTGNAAVLSSRGSDTSVDIQLAPKGNGAVKFGNHAVKGAEALTGYITIKDSTGTLRKLAVLS